MGKENGGEKKFRSLKTFSMGENIFKKNVHYTLTSVEKNESMNIFYLSDSEGKHYMFPEFTLGCKFEEYFISMDNERRINIDRILYED